MSDHDHPAEFAKLNEDLVEWIEANKTRFCCEHVQMPVIEDYVLIVAMNDVGTEAGSQLTFVHSHAIPGYRLRGLIETAALMVAFPDEDD